MRIFAALLYLVVCIPFAGQSQDLSLAWLATMRGKESDQGRDVVADDKGNVYVTGGFQATLDMDPSAKKQEITSDRAFSPFVQKLNVYGELEWVRKLQGIYWGHGFAIDIDQEGNILVTGSCRAYPNLNESAPQGRQTSNMFIWKLDSKGNTLWKRGFETQKDIVGKGLDTGPDCRVIVAGSYMGKTDLDPGPGEFLVTATDYHNAFALTLDKNGDFLWGTTFGGARYDYGNDVAIDSTGAFYFVGSFEASSHTNAPCYSVSDVGHQDIFIQKFGKEGELLWEKTLGGPRYDVPEQVVVDQDGNLIITGAFMQTVDFDPGPGVNYLTTDEHPNDWVECKDSFVLKLDSLGNHLWSVGYGGRQNDHPFDLAVDFWGDIYVCGIFHQKVDFDPGYEKFEIRSGGDWDGYVQKLDSNGDFVWAYSIGAAGWDFATGIDVDAFGFVYVTGYFDKRVNFDPSEKKSITRRAKGLDIYVQKTRQFPKGFNLVDIANLPRLVISEQEEEQVKSERTDFVFFPNPAQNFITIKLPDSYASCQVRMYNSGGQLILEMNASDLQRFQFDTSQLASGSYLLEVENELWKSAEKVVIER